MAEPSPYRETGGDAAGPGRGRTTGAPRWVKVFGIIAIVVALLFVIMLLTGGGGGHGPGRHTWSPDTAGHTPPGGAHP